MSIAGEVQVIVFVSGHREQSTQTLLNITDLPHLHFDKMSIPPADQESLLGSAGYSPETSPTLESSTSRPKGQRLRYQKMDSSGPTGHNDPAPRYSSPVSAISNYESLETNSTGLGITQRPQLPQRVPVGSRISSSKPFQPSSNTHAPEPAGFSNPFENSYVENASGTPRITDEEDITKGKNIFSESPELPSVTVNEVPRATPLIGTPMSMNNDDYDNVNLSMGKF